MAISIGEKSRTYKYRSKANIYTVKKGDTLSQIATKYGVTLGDLLRANPQIKDPNIIFPGQEIYIPQKGKEGIMGPGMPGYYEDHFEVADNVKSEYRAFTAGTSFEANEIPRTGNTFIDSVALDAIETQRNTGVPASVTIAQAILESGWGKSSLAREANNFFGIKGTGPAGYVIKPTKEYVNGRWITVNAKFKAYHNPQESFEDHARLIANNRRYSKAMENLNDPKQFARELQRAGYATDPNYANKLISIMDKYNLYQFDKIANTNAPLPIDDNNNVRYDTYTVVPGDTLTKIARKFNTTWQELAEINNLDNPNLIYPGQKLRVPIKEGQIPKPKLPDFYTVKPGDTMWSIARRFGVDLSDLINANPQIKNPSLIHPGQKIYFPKAEATPKTERPKTEPTTNYQTYVVQRGDTMWAIARKFGVTLDALKSANPQIKNPNLIHPGDKINIPKPGTIQGPETIPPPDNNKAARLIQAARKYLGVPYQWGGGHWNNPYPERAYGLDCSGFVGQVFHDIGIELPGGGWRGNMRYHGLATHHFQGGKPVSANDLRPGDIVFWGKNGHVTHEAIYIGNGKIIVAPKPGEKISIRNMYWTGYMGARRYL